MRATATRDLEQAQRGAANEFVLNQGPVGVYFFSNPVKAVIRTTYIEVTMTIRFIPSRLGNHEYS